jgi:hypothetical protein
MSAGEILDPSALGEVTAEMLRETFPHWRVFESGRVWWAMRPGACPEHGPGSLLKRVLGAPDLPGLADRLCLQQHLDQLDPEELAAVWRDVTMPPDAAALPAVAP